MITHVKCHQPGRLVRDSMPKVFTGGWLNRQLQLGVCVNSILSEGKQGFSINHVVCTIRLSTASHSCQFREWWDPSLNPSSLMPAKGHPCKQGSQWMAGLLLFLHSSRARIWTRICAVTFYFCLCWNDYLNCWNEDNILQGINSKLDKFSNWHKNSS